jgi:hypothetical protein
MGYGQPVWLVTRYDDVKRVLADGRFVVDPANVPGERERDLSDNVLRVLKVPREYLDFRLVGINMSDGADHVKFRKLARKTFTARRVARLRPRIEEIVESLLDRLPATADDGAADLLQQFCYPLSKTVLAEFVGIPEEDRPKWYQWQIEVSPLSEHDRDEAWREVIDYIQNLIDRRRATPANDLVSALVRAQGKSVNLGENEMISLVVTLGLTSQQTAHLIANGTVALLTHPDQFLMLRKNPDLLPFAVHEMLRWCTPTPITPRVRYATEDLEIGGMPVRKGEAAAVALVAADWDPRKFDNPERLDITRVPDRRPETHLAFGHGTHYCVGAALARLESEVAFGALLRQYPDLALAVEPDDLEYGTMPGMWRILQALPVRLA